MNRGKDSDWIAADCPGLQWIEFTETNRAWILIASTRLPPFGFDINEMDRKTNRARILTESTRLPPFGFDIKDIGSDSHEWVQQD